MKEIMNRFFVFLFGIFLVFGLVGTVLAPPTDTDSSTDGVSDGNGNGDECIPDCPDEPCRVICPDCSCSDRGCSSEYPCGSYCIGSQSAVSPPTSIKTYYYYSGSQHNKTFTTDSNYQYWNPEITWHTYGSCYDDEEKCGDCGCDVYKCRKDINCNCEYSDKPWYPWYIQECNNCGNGRKCDSKRCKGWCMDHTPVYDNLSGCNIGFSSVPYSKYTIENMDQSGGCDCRYLKISNYYECDSSQIDDSHPCSSNNCAPDFSNGRAYCCPDEKCAYRKSNSLGDSDICYDNGAEIQWEGHKLTCDNGIWKTVGNGKTIYQIPVFYDEHTVYPDPDTYGYVDYSITYPLDFENTKKVEVSITNSSGEPDSRADTKIFDSGGNLKAKGKGDKVVSAKLKKGEIRFYPTGDLNGQDINMFVEVSIPKEEKCIADDTTNGIIYYPYVCESEMYCTESYTSSSNAPSYCCPEGSCAYDSACYSEGKHDLTINGQPCKRRCVDSQWSGLGEGEICEKKCDCEYSGELSENQELSEDLSKYDLSCKETLKDSNKICCPNVTCAVEPGVCCLPKKYSHLTDEFQGIARCKVRSSGKECSCVERGDELKWDCINTTIKKEFSRTLLTKKSNNYIISSIFSRKGLSDIENIESTKLIVFFDKGTYTGNNIDIDGNSNNLQEKVSISLDADKVSDLPTEVEVRTSIPANEYFYYTGSALIVEAG